MFHENRFFRFIFGAAAVVALAVIPVLSGAQSTATSSSTASVSDLQQKIDEHNKTIGDLEKEISQYQAQVDAAGEQAASLSGAIKVLEITSKKLSAEIQVIVNQIDNTNLVIDGLTSDIGQKKNTIDQEVAGIGEVVKQLDQLEATSLIETLLTPNTLSSFWNKMSELKQFESSVADHMSRVKIDKSALEGRERAAEVEKAKLSTLRGQLADKKKIAEDNRRTTNKLLSQTKSKEANYKKILQQKLALKNAFEAELLMYESQLKIAIDASKLPRVGSGVLSWPVDSVFITQYFGNTSFARNNPQVYNGQGHNGIDLRAAIGTPIRASLSGRVVGVGDTDAVCAGASYGKWIMIEHQNGLSTLYAHLSLIKVATGENIATGDVIGYSGETGYATGPHLHFTVFATQGVSVMSRKSRVCGGTYTMPVASLNAYLNPLSYL